jgi:hypothetical protein
MILSGISFQALRLSADVVNLAFHEFFERQQYLLPEGESGIRGSEVTGDRYSCRGEEDSVMTRWRKRQGEQHQPSPIRPEDLECIRAAMHAAKVCQVHLDSPDTPWATFEDSGTLRMGCCGAFCLVCFSEMAALTVRTIRHALREGSGGPP